MVARRQVTLLVMLGILGLVVYLVGCAGGKQVDTSADEERKALIDENERLVANVEQARRNLEAAKRENQDALREINELQSGRAKAAKRIEALERELTEAEAKVTVDQGEIADLQGKLARAMKELEDLKTPPVYPTTYRVKRGDCLWYIAGYEFIYNDPFKWPVIYKANKDKIRDPDLIYPMQVFAIPRENV